MTNPTEPSGQERHYHEAEYDEDENLLDRCGRCGKDIRNDIHYRSDEKPWEES